MVKRKVIFSMAILLGVSVSNTALMAGTLDMVKEKCAACHSEDGNSKYNKVPNIAGFSETALTDMMGEYKDGDRTGDKFKPDDGDETDMNAIIKDLSDKDIEALAKFYSNKPYKVHKQKADAKLAKKGAKIHRHKCEKCHSDGGTNPEDDASLLAGQPREYITRAFEKISKREQPMPKKMRKKFKKLKENQKKALIEYYVSGGGAQ